MTVASATQDVRAELAPIVAGVEILDATRFVVAGGASFDVGAPAGDAGLGALRSVLTSVLYTCAYARGWTGTPVAPDDDAAAGTTRASADDLVGPLRAANPGAPRWDAGWTVYALGADGVVHARKADAHRRLQPGAFVFSGGPGSAPGVGATVTVLVEHELVQPQAGYYHAFGRTPGCQLEEASTVRLYFNTPRPTTPRLVEHLVRTLDRYAVPFRLKCLTPPSEHDRRDACVLYVADRFTPMALRLVAGLPASVLSALRPDVPLFARRMHPGVGLAEDPPNGESFGLSRMRLVAAGLVDAWGRGASAPAARLDAIAAAFAAHGLTFARPHLNRGSVDRFVWPAPPPTRTGVVAPRSEAGASFLAVADEIGRTLCRDAVWDGRRCIWLGWAMTAIDGAYRPAFRAVPLTLYDGVAGIALFLTRLHERTGDPAVAACRDGATTLLLERGDTLAPRASFFSGLLGVAFTLVEIGERTGRGSLIERGLALAGRVGDETLDEHALDVITGAAGTIPVLLALGGRYGRPELEAIAERHGRTLLAHRVETGGGCAWPSPIPAERPLVGYSHGAAGMAVALLELHAVTGEAAWLEAALGAMRYERQAYSPAHANWPDYRSDPPRPEGAPRTYPVAWCHGATGIGLARLRVLELLGDDPEVRGEIEAAVATVAATLAAPVAPADFCLCHGAAGNAELLLVAATQLDRPHLRSQAEDVGRRGQVLFGAGRRPWPCSRNQGGTSPDLMLGLAGIGHFYLRLADPVGVPTVLLQKARRHEGTEARRGCAASG